MFPVASPVRSWGLFLLLPFDACFLEQAGCLCLGLDDPETLVDEDTEGAVWADGGSVAVMVDMSTKVVSNQKVDS